MVRHIHDIHRSSPGLDGHRLALLPVRLRLFVLSPIHDLWSTFGDKEQKPSSQQGGKCRL